MRSSVSLPYFAMVFVGRTGIPYYYSRNHRNKQNDAY